MRHRRSRISGEQTDHGTSTRKWPNAPNGLELFWGNLRSDQKERCLGVEFLPRGGMKSNEAEVVEVDRVANGSTKKNTAVAAVISRPAMLAIRTVF
ncbi:hypothetical protein JX266_014166 [Neoarthrinium moseri]|nr:hypothetical protein JX266_014166 [Neoarthrinium moseri]